MYERCSAKTVALSLVLIVSPGSTYLLAVKNQQTGQARPPKWPQEVLDVFFDDARKELFGPRPDFGKAENLAKIPLAAATPGEPAPSNSAWSQLIDAETIETEIKRLAHAVTGGTASPTEFKGGSYKDCRRHFSVLAMLFGIAAEYDGAVRWSDAAPAIRDALARAGRNCKVGTDQTYREAGERSKELADLVRGSRPRLPSAERVASWSDVADRAPLMQRMETAHQERLTQWLANERQFAKNRDEVRHEAQLMAAMADVIGREGFEYWDDEQYAQYARDLRQAAADIAAAAKLENYNQAKQAISRATSACTNCHEGYRG